MSGSFPHHCTPETAALLTARYPQAANPVPGRDVIIVTHEELKRLPGHRMPGRFMPPGYKMELIRRVVPDAPEIDREILTAFNPDMDNTAVFTNAAGDKELAVALVILGQTIQQDARAIAAQVAGLPANMLGAIPGAGTDLWARAGLAHEWRHLSHQCCPLRHSFTQAARYYKLQKEIDADAAGLSAIYNSHAAGPDVAQAWKAMRAIAAVIGSGGDDLPDFQHATATALRIGAEGVRAARSSPAALYRAYLDIGTQADHFIFLWARRDPAADAARPGWSDTAFPDPPRLYAALRALQENGILDKTATRGAAPLFLRSFSRYVPSGAAAWEELRARPWYPALVQEAAQAAPGIREDALSCLPATGATIPRLRLL